jgi:hypothetical protein
MSGINGNFDIGGNAFRYEVIEIHTFDGKEYTDEVEDHIMEADRIFYVVVAGNGEEYHRWIAGPYETAEDVEAAIEDETDAYEGSSASS